MPERMTVGALIEELQKVAASGPFGDLTPVVVQVGDGYLRYRPWLELRPDTVYAGQDGGEYRHEGYDALVIRGEYD